MSALFAQTKTAIIEIKGMTCPLCTTAIKKSLKKTKGVIKAKVRLNTQKATVIFDDTKVSKKKLLDAVKNAGYSGKIVN
jgi:mercuric ion binding protein